MKRIAYLTMEDMGDFVTDFHLSFGDMRALGWQIDTIVWHSPTDWNDYDAVYICTPWDYPQRQSQFLDVLANIESSQALLINDLALVIWTLEKTYLRDVEQRGGGIVPSTWYNDFEAADPTRFFVEHGTDRVVIKPIVGASAVDTFMLEAPVSDQLHETLKSTFAKRGFLVQPFVESIQTEGEYSLMFFGGAYSHAVRKIPMEGDFRVQEEHDARIVAVEPPAMLLKTAKALFASLEPEPAYGRGDWVLGDDGRFLLMELELIEPSLFLRADGGAAARFARTLDQRFQEFTRKRALA